MNYTYELAENGNVVLRSDGAAIPVDEANRDYRAYLKWLNSQSEE